MEQFKAIAAFHSAQRLRARPADAVAKVVGVAKVVRVVKDVDWQQGHCVVVLYQSCGSM